MYSARELLKIGWDEYEKMSPVDKKYYEKKYPDIIQSLESRFKLEGRPTKKKDTWEL